MKTSYYNLYAESAKGVICYNTITENFGLIPLKVYNFLNTENFSSINTGTLEKLKELKFIIPDEINEFEELKKEYQNSLTDNTFYLTLLPSLDCNVRCWYCFEKLKRGSRLGKDTPIAILNYVKNIFQNSDIEYLRIELFGGEPLLYFEEEVFPLLRDIDYYVRSIGKKISIFIVTNALCIENHMFPLFKSINAKFQISIDGYRDRHNKVKKLVDKNIETYQRVIETIINLTEYHDTYINLRINFDDDTLARLPEIINDLRDVDRKKIVIHLERIWQTRAKKEFNKYLSDAILAFQANGFKISYMNFFRRSHSCKVSKPNQAVISYDRMVYKCIGRDFTEGHREGILNMNGEIFWDTDKINERLSIYTYNNDLCKKCKFLPLCWGPCCQKQLEDPINIIKYCQLEYMEIPVNEYIKLKFNDALIREALK